MAVVQEPRRQTDSLEPSAFRRASQPRMGNAHIDQQGSNRRERVFIRMSSQDKQRAQYWADKRGFSSVNEYLAEAVAEQIRRENLDYDLPTLEIARLNELIDQVKASSTNLANLERVVTSGFESLIGLTRGDNYLLDEEDGELR